MEMSKVALVRLLFLLLCYCYYVIWFLSLGHNLVV